MNVATAVSNARFLAGTHCIEFVWDQERYDAGDAYGLKQLACCLLRQGPNALPFIVERHRRFKTTAADPWPRWRPFLGSGFGPHGFSGSCALHLQELLAPARLVALKRTDRVPPEEPVWDPYRGGPRPDRLAIERRAFEVAR